jgi:hypothetical protein
MRSMYVVVIQVTKVVLFGKLGKNEVCCNSQNMRRFQFSISSFVGTPKMVLWQNVITLIIGVYKIYLYKKLKFPIIAIGATSYYRVKNVAVITFSPVARRA